MPLRKWSVTGYCGTRLSRPYRFWTYKGALKTAKDYTNGVGYDRAVIDGPLPRYVLTLRADWQNATDQDKKELQALFPELYQAIERCVALGEANALVMEWLKLSYQPEDRLGSRSYYRSLAGVVYATQARATKVVGAQ